MRGVAVRGWRAVLAVITCVAITMSGLISVSTPTPAHAASGINVFFDANGGSFTGGLSRKSVSSDATGVVTASQISGVGVPSNTGYTFDGWYSTAQGGEKLNTSEGLIVEYSQSWYAHWKRTSTTPTPTPTPTGNVSVTIQTGGVPFGSYVFPGSSVTHSFPSWDSYYGSWRTGVNRYGGQMLSAPSTGLNYSKTQASLTVSSSSSYRLDLLPYTPLNTSPSFVSGGIYRDFQEDVLFWVARASGEWDWTVLAPIGGSGTTVDLSAYAGRSVTLQPVTRRAVRTGSGIVDKTNPLLSVVLNPDGGSWPDGSTGNKSVEGPVFASTATGASQNTALTPQAGSLDQKYLRGGASAPSKNGLPLYDWSGDVWSGSATLTARYGYRVTLNGNGGTFPDGSTTKTTTSANIVEPTRSGYTLIGWIGSDGRTYPTGSTVPVSSDTTLYAQWRAMYSTVFDANGGAFYNGDRSRTLYSVSASVSADDLDAWLKKPVHALNASGQHVVFTKWTSNPDGSGTVLDTSQVLNVVTPRTWYAQYRQSDLKITLDAGSGKFATTYPRQGVTVASDPSQYDIYASASGVVDGSRFASIPEAFRKNPSNANEMQVAARWNTKSDGSGVDLPASGDMQITRSVTFYPVWEKADSLTLKLGIYLYSDSSYSGFPSGCDPYTGHYYQSCSYYYRRFTDGANAWSANTPGRVSDDVVTLYGKKGDLLDLSPFLGTAKVRCPWGSISSGYSVAGFYSTLSPEFSYSTVPPNIGGTSTGFSGVTSYFVRDSFRLGSHDPLSTIPSSLRTNSYYNDYFSSIVPRQLGTRDDTILYATNGDMTVFVDGLSLRFRDIPNGTRLPNYNPPSGTSSEGAYAYGIAADTVDYSLITGSSLARGYYSIDGTAVDGFVTNSGKRADYLGYAYTDDNRSYWSRDYDRGRFVDLNLFSPSVAGRHFIGWASVRQPASATTQEQLETDQFTGLLSDYAKTHYFPQNYRTMTQNRGGGYLQLSDLYPWYGYMLRLDANGGVFSDGSTSRSVASNGDGVVDAASVNSVYGVGSSGVPTRVGYTFMGWSMNPRWKPGDGNAGDFPSSGSLTLGSDTTYYAKWKRNPVLTLNANGGSFDGLSSVRISSDSHGRILSTALAGFVPARSRARLADPAWNTRSDGSGDSRSTSSDVTLSSDVTWYAQWDLDKFYVNFVATPSGASDLTGGGTVRWLSSPSSGSSRPTWTGGVGAKVAGEDEDHPFTSGTSDASNVPSTGLSLGGTYRAVLSANPTRDGDGNSTQRVFSFAGWSRQRQDLTQATPVLPSLVSFPADSSGRPWLGGSTSNISAPSLYAAYRYTTFNLMDAPVSTLSAGVGSRRYTARLAWTGLPSSSTIPDPNSNDGLVFPVAHRNGFVFMGWARSAADARRAAGLEASGAEFKHLVECAPYDDAASSVRQCRVDAGHAGVFYAVWQPVKVRVHFADKTVSSFGRAPTGCNVLAPSTRLTSFDPSLGGFQVSIPSPASVTGYQSEGGSDCTALNSGLRSLGLYVRGWADYSPAGPVRPDYTAKPGQWAFNLGHERTNWVRDIPSGSNQFVSLASTSSGYVPRDPVAGLYRVADAAHRTPGDLVVDRTLYAMWGIRVRSLPSAGGPASLIALVAGIILTLLLIGVSVMRRAMPVYSHTSHGRHAL